MRTIAAGAATSLAGHAVPMVMLVEMDLSSPLNLNTSNATLVLGGTTYYGTKGLGKISQIGDTSAEVKGLSFELSGAPSDKISLALKGRAVKIVTCPHCAKQGGNSVMHRWHFEKCKLNQSAGHAGIAKKRNSQHAL